MDKFNSRVRKFIAKKKESDDFTGLSKATGISVEKLRMAMEEGTLTVSDLRRLLDATGIPYDAITPNIKSVGGEDEQVIRNPKFPIDLYCPDGARLLAAAIDDGNIDRTSHFEYRNPEPEKVRIVVNLVWNIFGDIDPALILDEKGRLMGVHLGNSMIGDVLLKAGAVEGRTTRKDYGVPDMIKLGDCEIRDAYFEQVIRDEGYIDWEGYQLSISRAQLLDRNGIPRLSSGGSSSTDEVLWTLTIESGLRDNVPKEQVAVFKDFMSKIRGDWVPTILREERDMLEEA